MRLALLLVPIAVVAAVGAGCGARGSTATEAPPNQYDLWALDVKSGKLRNLTRTKGHEASPSFSPDGQRVAFEGNVQGPGLYVMNADGSHVRLIARGHGAWGLLDDRHRAPQWSPDGKRLVWATADRCEDIRCKSRDVWVVAADGSGRSKLASDAGYATWSPDGASVAYAGGVDPEGYGGDVYVVGADGGNRRLVADGSAPVWSAAGWIAYLNGDRLLAVKPDGTGSRAIADGLADGDFGWSPNGRQVWFAHQTPNEDTELYVATLSGPVTRVTRRAGTDHLLAWSPTANEVAWLHQDPLDIEHSDLMTADSGGVAPRRLGEGPFIQVDEPPSWSPDGRTLVLSARPPDPHAKRDPIPIRKIDVETGDVAVLTGFEGDADAPSVSHDDRLAFYENDEAGTFLWTADPDGGNRTRIAPGNGAPGLDLPWPPAWSPDGKTIAFVRDDGCSTELCDAFEIWLAGAQGVAPRRLTAGKHPSWSPDGKRLVFADRGEVAVIGSDGKGHKVIGKGTAPTWSPVGDLIAYATYDGRLAVTRLVVARPDGSARRVLLPAFGPESEITWSADGKSILLGDSKVSVEGGKPVRFISTKHGVEMPSFSPDGKRLAWVAWTIPEGEQPNDLYVANADGSGIRRVTNERQIIDSPAWSADGRSLYYIRWPHFID